VWDDHADAQPKERKMAHRSSRWARRSRRKNQRWAQSPCCFKGAWPSRN